MQVRVQVRRAHKLALYVLDSTQVVIPNGI
jgi:hypothetical protein